MSITARQRSIRKKLSNRSVRLDGIVLSLLLLFSHSSARAQVFKAHCPLGLEQRPISYSEYPKLSVERYCQKLYIESSLTTEFRETELTPIAIDFTLDKHGVCSGFRISNSSGAPRSDVALQKVVAAAAIRTHKFYLQQRVRGAESPLTQAARIRLSHGTFVRLTPSQSEVMWPQYYTPTSPASREVHRGTWFSTNDFAPNSGKNALDQNLTRESMMPFDEEKWRSPHETWRLLMLPDLLKTHPLIGAPREKIHELLGEPSQISDLLEDFDRDKGEHDWFVLKIDALCGNEEFPYLELKYRDNTVSALRCVTREQH